LLVEKCPVLLKHLNELEPVIATLNFDNILLHFSIPFAANVADNLPAAAFGR
jgi:hypothetical protein